MGFLTRSVQCLPDSYSRVWRLQRSLWVLSAHVSLRVYHMVGMRHVMLHAAAGSRGIPTLPAYFTGALCTFMEHASATLATCCCTTNTSKIWCDEAGCHAFSFGRQPLLCLRCACHSVPATHSWWNIFSCAWAGIASPILTIIASAESRCRTKALSSQYLSNTTKQRLKPSLQGQSCSDCVNSWSSQTASVALQLACHQQPYHACLQNPPPPCIRNSCPVLIQLSSGMRFLQS